jgi:hypothetical protein
MADNTGTKATRLVRTSEFLPTDETDLFFVSPHVSKASPIVASFVLTAVVCAILSLI